MRSLAAKQRQCTCSARFRTEIDLKRHLSDHAEQRRVSLIRTLFSIANHDTPQIRERMIGDLQAEALKHEAHTEADDESSSESDIDQDSDGDSESEGTRAEALVCPSCPRSAPFPTRQKLRRHHEQDTECHEVCVFCHVSFKRVRKFKRHAETCVGDSERKRAYMDETCKELTILSDTKLEKALRERKKLSRDESEQAANSVERAGRNPRAPKRQRTRQRHADNATDAPNLLPWAAPTAIDHYLVRSSGAPTAPANVHIQNQTLSLSTEATEAVVPSLGVLEEFDAPLMHIMNSVPLETYSWPVHPYDGNLPGNDPAAYRLS
ncbi:hypothetical protein FOQG_15976 [Fusarium oxysporum f. sp. raphani 54005]|uniref:Uncharacterized protein n=1 Tax=Fusarium oxysporum f. sp. raphani 54005 TaxID=1089458 RepID=X0BKJ0_FUSOX|nr:hypothetical protein FOQG_15976 [Fusarium oxysporum f. sp. raphani 54005]